jgi:hypothetical protein
VIALDTIAGAGLAQKVPQVLLADEAAAAFVARDVAESWEWTAVACAGSYLATRLIVECRDYLGERVDVARGVGSCHARQQTSNKIKSQA